MIKKLRVKNFKSLKDVEVELGKFNVFIGPNNSGKSNLLDSLVFLAQTASTDLRSVLIQRGGFEHVVFGGTEKIFEISIDFLLNGEPSSYCLAVNKQADVEEEKLVVGGTVAIDRNGSRQKLLGNDGQIFEQQTTVNLSTLYKLGQEKDFPLVRNTNEYLRSWQLYQIVTPEIRKTLPARKCFDLDKNGANVAQVLITLHNERPKLFARIEEILKQGIPEIEELLTPLTTDGQTYVALREKEFEKPFDYYQVSDGTLKLLAYITAITLPESGLICFEEPENFIHPELLELLVELMKKSEKQIILTTHSPNYINFVEPEDIRIVERDKGETRISKVKNPRRLREALKEMGLGELWYSGELGGVP